VRRYNEPHDEANQIALAQQEETNW
jgi:hypothetical protein